jgi:hypothetical protein
VLRASKFIMISADGMEGGGQITRARLYCTLSSFSVVYLFVNFTH